MEELLKKLLKEVQGIRDDLKVSKIPTKTCDRSSALSILGLKNRRYLQFFHEKGYLNRQENGGSTFQYYIEECEALAHNIKIKKISVPKVQELYKLLKDFKNEQHLTKNIV